MHFPAAHFGLNGGIGHAQTMGGHVGAAFAHVASTTVTQRFVPGVIEQHRKQHVVGPARSRLVTAQSASTAHAVSIFGSTIVAASEGEASPTLEKEAAAEGLAAPAPCPTAAAAPPSAAGSAVA